MQTSQQSTTDLPLTLDNRVPRSVRLTCLIRMFEAGGEYSVRELALRFGVTDDRIRDDLLWMQTCEYIRLPLENRLVHEWRWRVVR